MEIGDAIAFTNNEEIRKNLDSYKTSYYIYLISIIVSTYISLKIRYLTSDFNSIYTSLIISYYQIFPSLEDCEQ